MKRHIQLALLSLALSAFAPVAAAQDNIAKARALAAEGLTHYEAGEYDKAIKAFDAAYALAPAPGILFNIAQAYRLKGPTSCREAQRYYKQFLGEAKDDPNRATAEEHLRAMDKCVAAQITNTLPPAAEPEPEPALRPTPPSEPKRSGRGYTYAAIGSAALGAGLVSLGLWQFSKTNDAADLLSKRCKDGCEWNAENQALESSRDSHFTKAIIFTSAGGAALVGSGVLYYLGARHSTESPQVTLAPSDHGWALIASGRF